MRLLSAEMLRPGLPASLACAGRSQMPALRAKKRLSVASGAAYVPSARTKPRVPSRWTESDAAS